MINRPIKIINWLPYLMTCSGEKNKKPILWIRVCDRREVTKPMKGFVKKLTTKIKIATVTAKGRRIARPVRKYFFIPSLLSFAAYLARSGNCFKNFIYRGLDHTLPLG